MQRACGWIHRSATVFVALFLAGCLRDVPANPTVDPDPDEVLIYVVDTRDQFIARMDDMAGSGWVRYGSAGRGVGQFQYPLYPSLDPQGRLHVADVEGRRIVRLDDLSGAAWTTLEASATRPMIVKSTHFDAQGRLLVAGNIEGDQELGRMDDITGKGWTPYAPTAPGAERLNNAVFATTDADGRIYVVDHGNQRIVRMDDLAGTGWVSFGTKGDGIGQYEWPEAIAIDPRGRIYVSDGHLDRISRMDDMSGTGWIAFSRVGPYTISAPHQMAFSPEGRMYIADTGNQRILRIDDLAGENAVAYGLSSGRPHEPDAPGFFQAPKGLIVVPRT